MSPFTLTNGHDFPGLIDEFVPGEAAVIDDIVVGFEDTVGEPVVAHELPDILDRVQFGTSGRQRHEGDIGGNDQFGRAMPPSLIEYQNGMRTRRDVEGYLLKMQAHRFAVATGQDDASPLALGGTYRTEDPGRSSALIFGRRGSSALLGPTAGELGLLTDPRLILPPQLYGCVWGKDFADLRQTGGEVFLKAAISSERCP